MRRAGRAVSSALGAVLLAAVLVAGAPRPADAPSPVGGTVSDPGRVLGDEASEVRLRLQEFGDETGAQLYVVYVLSFDGQDGIDWANRAAELSDLREQDILLAVATEDRAYGVSVTDGVYDEDDLAEVRTDLVEPDLRAGDWPQAALSAADGYTDMIDGSFWDSPWTWIVGGGVLVLVAGAVGSRGPRRRRDASYAPAGLADGASTPPRATTAALRVEASAALVALDDALRSSGQELEFAKAEFGLAATDGFVVALDAAGSRLAEAFALHTALVERPATAVSDQEARDVLTRVLALTVEADALLDEQSDAFAALRDLQARLDTLLPELAERSEEVRARIGPASDALRQLRIMYPPSSLVSLEQKIPQATALLDTVGPSVEEGLSLVAGGSRRGAAARYRVAQEAVAHASTFLQDVHDGVEDLAASTALIAQAVASIQADLADVGRLAGALDEAGAPAALGPAAPDPARTAAASAAARDAIAAAQVPESDPLAVLERLRSAEEALDAALAPAREAESVRLRVRERADAAVQRAQVSVGRLDAYVQQHRAALSEAPRARLAAARESLAVALAALAADPAGALVAAQATEQAVTAGHEVARADVDRRPAWSTSDDDSDGGWGGSGRSYGWSWSSGSGSSRSSSRSSSSRSRSARSSGSSRRSSPSRSRSSRGRSGGGGRF